MTTAFKIKESSWIARIAAFKLRSEKIAIVLGHTIHLHNTTRATFLQNNRWLKHELCHIRQFEKYGYVKFIIKYLSESVRQGYYQNKFEIEARNAEND